MSFVSLFLILETKFTYESFSFCLVAISHNTLSGRIPVEIGMLKSLKILFMGSNALVGPLPEEIENLQSLEFFILNDNNINGTLPNFFGNLTNLRWLDAHTNRLSGPFPNSLWDSELEVLALNDNELSGSISNDFCRDGSMKLAVDNLPWFLDEPLVDCLCCGSSSHCHIWQKSNNTQGGSVRPMCPPSNVYKINYTYSFEIKDVIGNVVFNERHFTEPQSSEVCVSPTGCYRVSEFANFNQDSSDEIISYNLIYPLSYSRQSKGLIQQDACEPVEICELMIDSSHPKRKGLNHLTQVVMPNLSFLGQPSSSEYKALCWIMKDDPLYDIYEICDGTLLQRYVIAYFYMSQNWTVELDKMASKPTCQWEGIKCDSTQKFVEELNFRSRSIAGTLISEIGLLTRLRSIDLSDNSIGGTLNPLLFNYKPKLESINIKHNNLGGNIPGELFKLPKLKKVILKDNKLVGTIPMGFEYSPSLGKYTEMMCTVRFQASAVLTILIQMCWMLCTKNMLI